jgi:hypothetical protein
VVASFREKLLFNQLYEAANGMSRCPTDFLPQANEETQNAITLI